MGERRIGKKGIETMMLVILILGAAALIILAMFAHSFYLNIKEKLAIQECKQSIAAHTFIASKTEREVFTDIKCPTRELMIKLRDEEKAKKQIAEDMHRCWYEWNRGNGQYFKGDGVFCHICSIYTFDDNNTKLPGFMNYLGTAKITTKYPGDTPGISYQDYFQGFETPNSAEKVKSGDIRLTPEEKRVLAEKDVINTSKDYAAIFVYASGKDAIQKALEGGGRTTTFTIGLGVATVGGLAGGLAIATATGLVNFWNPAGWVILAGVGLTVGGIAIYNALFNVEDPEWVSFITFREYSAQEIKDLGCEKMETNQLSHSVK